MNRLSGNSGSDFLRIVIYITKLGYLPDYDQDSYLCGCLYTFIRLGFYNIVVSPVGKVHYFSRRYFRGNGPGVPSLAELIMPDKPEIRGIYFYIRSLEIF